MSPDSLFIAVDLGAGSGRVFVCGLGRDELRLDEVRRFHYPPRRERGHLRWDLGRILMEIQEGLAAAAVHAGTLQRPIASIGIDSWGVDYGLVDRAGHPLEDPICYRDERTTGAMERVFQRVPREEIFARTGIQFLSFNTLFQLAAHVDEGLPDGAYRLLLMPDLLASVLSGRAITEYTNATTTQMVCASSSEWDSALLTRLNLPRQLLSDISPSGSAVGLLRETFSTHTGLEDVPILATATHDTASAIAGTPLAPGWAYISSGTWSLVGVERDRPLIDEAVARHNFTNEGGVFGTVRFLKNVMGLWILERCRAEWERAGVDVDHARLLEAVARLDRPPGLVFPDDRRLLNPPSMLSALGEQLQETGQAIPSDPIAVARIVLDSLALRYASVLRAVTAVTGMAVPGVRIVGGGSRNAYLNQVTATACGCPVLAGPVEATVIGNALVQAIAQGRFPSLTAAREHVAANVTDRLFVPAPSADWAAVQARYDDIESRYADLVA